MRAAVLSELGRSPELGERPAPAAADGEVVLEVLAAPLNPLDIAVGSGRYFAGHPPVPYVPGSEAVGRRRDSGELVWAFGDGFGLRRDGTFAELAACSGEALVPVPDGAEPAVAAALGIAGLAGWLPLAWRAPVREDDRVLVLGATGTAGRVAVQVAKLLGAERVVAAGRDAERLERATEDGADATVQLEDAEGLGDRFREACGGDGPTLVFDPLWGRPALAALEAVAPGARVVQLGQSAGAEASVRSGLIRGKQLDILGHTNFAVPRDVLAQEYGKLVRHAVTGGITIDVEQVSLDDVASAWERQAQGSGRKLVLVP
ncbi:MAG: zinc-binding alcohol dehydrogenase family protein [Gaiellaceae bacterium]